MLDASTVLLNRVATEAQQRGTQEPLVGSALQCTIEFQASMWKFQLAVPAAEG